MFFGQRKNCLQLNIKESIDERISRYVALALEYAEEINPDLILIHMDTYGGTVVDADKIVARLLESKFKTAVFIDKNAGSAGSFISIACDSIYMTPGAVMGASTVVNQNMEVQPEKIQSYMRKKMRATAETKGRNPEIAEEIVGLYLQTDSAFVRTMTPKEALKLGYCEKQFDNIEDVLNHHQIRLNEQFELSATDKIIDYFLNPALKSILILLIFGGIYLEIKTPGLGIPALISIAAALLYFIPDYLYGFLAYWELLLFIVGLILIILEIFVIPGFGIAGVLGISFIFSGLFLSMVNNVDFNFDQVSSAKLSVAFNTIGIGFIGSIVLALLSFKLFLKSKTFKKIALQKTLNSRVNISKRNLLGKNGTAKTILRPSGKVEVEGNILDAETLGEYVEALSEIKVIDDSQQIIKVKKI